MIAPDSCHLEHTNYVVVAGAGAGAAVVFVAATGDSFVSCVVSNVNNFVF